MCMKTNKTRAHCPKKVGHFRLSIGHFRLTDSDFCRKKRLDDNNLQVRFGFSQDELRNRRGPGYEGRGPKSRVRRQKAEGVVRGSEGGNPGNPARSPSIARPTLPRIGYRWISAEG